MTICFLKFWMFDLCFVTKHMFFGKFKFWRKTMQLNTKTNEIIKCWVVVYIYIYLKHACVFDNLKFWKRKMSTHAQSISIFCEIHKFWNVEKQKQHANLTFWKCETLKTPKTKQTHYEIFEIWNFESLKMCCYFWKNKQTKFKQTEHLLKTW